MNSQFSSEALLAFIEYAGSKGLMNKATAAARKAAVKRISAILEAHETQDVTKLDIDEVMRRFSNLEGEAFTPQSLATYRSRFRAAVEDFVEWKRDPMTFRPARGGVSRKPQRSSSKEEGQQSNVGKHDVGPAAPNLSQTHSLPIPIRSDLTVYVHGIPFDLSKAEAKRIANVVLALAIEPEPEIPGSAAM